MPKPRVKCQKVYDQKPVVGESYDVIPKNHPRSHLNGRLCYTSTVIAITEDGFETLNTIYQFV